MREAGVGWRGGLLVVLLAAMGPGADTDVARAAQPACEAWPGEPDPLPDVGREDALLARWSRLRAEELAQTAEQAERVALRDANRIWAHVLCLDPASAEARAGLWRTQPVRVHRVRGVAVEAPPGSAPRLPLLWAFAALGEPVAVEAPPPPLLPVPRRTIVMLPKQPAPEPAPPEPEAAPAPAIPATVDAAIAEAESALRAARYADAVTAAERAREGLAPLAASPAVAGRRARLEVAAATALLALGRGDAAREGFLRALAAQPELALDPRTTSPKVLQAFEAARASAGEGRP